MRILLMHITSIWLYILIKNILNMIVLHIQNQPTLSPSTGSPFIALRAPKTNLEIGKEAIYNRDQNFNKSGLGISVMFYIYMKQSIMEQHACRS